MAANQILIVDNQGIVCSKISSGAHKIRFGNPDSKFKRVVVTGPSHSRKLIDLVNKTDVTSEVMEFLNDYATFHLEDTLMDFVLEAPDFRPRPNGGISSIETPLFHLKCGWTEKINQEGVRGIQAPNRSGSLVDISNLWRIDGIKFFAEQVLNFARLMPTIESLIRKDLDYYRENRGLLVNKNNQRFMNIFYINISGIVNPFSWMARYIKDTKLFSPIFNMEERNTLIHFDDPQIFTMSTERTAISAGLGTSYDILRLCGVDCPHAIKFKSSHLVMLIGALIIDMLGASDLVDFLPTNGEEYIAYQIDSYGDIHFLRRASTREELDLKDGEELMITTKRQRFINTILSTNLADKYEEHFAKAVLI